METNFALDELEKSARTARTAARLVAIALCVAGFIVLFQSGPLAAIALAMAAGTVSHTATTLGALLRVTIQLADNHELDNDVIASQAEVIAILREQHP